MPGGFVDPTLPAGFAPFNIENIGGQLFVTYAKQDADKHDDVAGPGNGFVDVFNTDGVCCYGTNTFIEEMNPERLAGTAEATFVVDSLDLVEGTYKLDVAVHKRDGFPYDYHRLLYTFRVKSRSRDVGIYRPRHRWTFSPNVQFRRGPGASGAGL